MTLNGKGFCSDASTTRWSRGWARHEARPAAEPAVAGRAFAVIHVGEIPTPAPDAYRPHRFRTKLRYKGHDFATVPVDVSPKEIDGMQMSEAVASADAAAWFGELGFPAPGPLLALPLAHQIAQKLHACTLSDAGPAWS